MSHHHHAILLFALAACGGSHVDVQRSAPPSAIADAGVSSTVLVSHDAGDASSIDHPATASSPKPVARAPITTKTLPAPSGWIELKAIKTTAFAAPATYFRVSREAPSTCASYRYDGANMISREPAKPTFFGVAEGDDKYTPPFTLVSEYKVNKIAPTVFELESGDWDYVDAKGKRYANVGKGVGLCGYPRYTVVGESALAFEVIEADLPFAAYDPHAVELWFKNEASCKASVKKAATPRGCE